jgi:pimeloyl-ACP methyl ester carboxylesterase
MTSQPDPRPVVNATTSRDGTRIEYLTVGSGPGLVVVPGALAVAADFLGLATLLASRFTVNIVERRGRGGSGPQGDAYGIESECDDLAAVCSATGSRLVFGHSFGGLVSLRLARSNPAIGAVAVFEPAVSVAGSIPFDWIPAAQAEVDRGDGMGAFLTFVRGVNPSQTGRVPRALLRLMLRRMMSSGELRRKVELMPASLREHAEVGRLDGVVADYAEIGAPVAIMFGTARTAHRTLPAPTSALAAAIPTAETIAFPGLNHLAPERRPERIADALLAFYERSLRPIAG